MHENSIISTKCFSSEFLWIDYIKIQSYILHFHCIGTTYWENIKYWKRPYLGCFSISGYTKNIATSILKFTPYLLRYVQKKIFKFYSLTSYLQKRQDVFVLQKRIYSFLKARRICDQSTINKLFIQIYAPFHSSKPM